jgi:hypothetical protein
MSLMLGLALIIGTTVAFADDKPADGTSKKKKKKSKTADPAAPAPKG